MSALISRDFIRRVALGFINNPGATLDEIASSVGKSRTSIHRSFGSRDKLLKNLADHAEVAIVELLGLVSVDKSPELLLPEIAAGFHDNWEFIEFLYMAGSECGEEVCQVWSRLFCAMDDFFLRGQKRGVFRIDVTSSVLTEIFVSTTCGLFSAERRGRIARKDCLPWMIDVFLRGTKWPRHQCADVTFG